MSFLKTRIANNLQNRQMILEAIDFMLGKIGNFSRTNGVSEAFLQFVHSTPAVLNFFAYFLRVQAQKRPFKPLVFFGLEVVESKPQLIEWVFQRNDLLQHWELTQLKGKQLLLFVQLF
jgi:hypothetical protein